ncbi:MAG: toxin [Desulfobulbaceae bacterium]|nr:toxin [Desulfobulbaceae bacterium]
MKYLSWSSEKNELLKTERGISFEEIVYQIETGNLLGIEENPTRSNQKIYIIELNNYAYVVPFVENAQEVFLKTAFPSRKYSKRYGLGGDE